MTQTPQTGHVPLAPFNIWHTSRPKYSNVMISACTIYNLGQQLTMTNHLYFFLALAADMELVNADADSSGNKFQATPN